MTGRPFSEYMDSEVLGPLGMTSSSYVWDEEVDRIAATPYDHIGEPIPGPRFTAMAAASLQTTLDDFLRFALASAGGEQKVLEAASVASMQQPVPPADHYGIGYDIESDGDRVLVGHGGSNDGWMARLTVDPKSGDGVVAMTNGSNGGVILSAVLCEWRASLSGEPCTDLPELPIEVALEALERVQGAYQVPDGPVLRFEVEGGRLFVRLRNGFTALAFARSDTEFFLAAANASMDFEIGEDGTASAMLFRQGDGEAQRAPKVDATGE